MEQMEHRNGTSGQKIADRGLGTFEVLARLVEFAVARVHRTLTEEVLIECVDTVERERPPVIESQRRDYRRARELAVDVAAGRREAVDWPAYLTAAAGELVSVAATLDDDTDAARDRTDRAVLEIVEPILLERLPELREYIESPWFERDLPDPSSLREYFRAAEHLGIDPERRTHALEALLSALALDARSAGAPEATVTAAVERTRDTLGYGWDVDDEGRLYGGMELALIPPTITIAGYVVELDAEPHADAIAHRFAALGVPIARRELPEAAALVDRFAREGVVGAHAPRN